MRRNPAVSKIDDLIMSFAMDMPKPKPSSTTHDQWTDDRGVVWWVHRWKQSCVDDGCAIHYPTDHHMVDWPKIMATGTIIVRICEHDYEHPDPDSFAFFERTGRGHMGVHSCDGCCMIQPVSYGETYTVIDYGYEVDY
jgi:hypothetical protein